MNPKSPKKIKAGFTLLEVLIGLLILTIAAGGVGWKMFAAVQKKKFHTAVERIKERLSTAQKLSISMQADWKVVLRKEKGGWTVETGCQEIARRKLPPLHVEGLEIGLEGRKKTELIEFCFFSSGQSLPDGVLEFASHGEKESWSLRK
jgi:prepilin-type N-terminal cleavage/methylation domain-containing protein